MATKSIEKIVPYILLIEVVLISILWIWSIFLWNRMDSSLDSIRMACWFLALILSVLILGAWWWEFETPWMKRTALLIGIFGIVTFFLAPYFWVQSVL